MRVGFVLLCVMASVANAQTPCSLANYGPNDGGWIGPVTRVVCTCNDCPQVRLEVRLVTGAYGDGNSIDRTVLNLSTPTYATFVHLADYAWRATPIQSDGGLLPTSVEGFARADSQAPSDPVLQQVLVDGGMYSLVFAPSADDGVGVDDYKGRFASADEPSSVAFGPGTLTSPLNSFLGPGDWLIGVYAKDRLDNLSALVWWPVPIHTVAAGPVAPPPAPLLRTPRYTNNGNLTVQISAPGEEFQFRLLRSDGRVHVSIPITYTQGATTVAGGFSGFDGEFLLSASQRIGTDVSDWSVGAPVAIDHTAPSAPGTLSAMQVAGDVVLSWGAATDNLGIDHYVVERGDGLSLTSSSLTVTDVLPAVGSYDYRVSALDLAGNRGAASNSVTVMVVPFDAGVVTDAGTDAGTGVDAGTALEAGVNPDGGSASDAGASASGSFAVGCGCNEGNGGAAWLAMFAPLVLSRRPRRRSN